MSIAEGSGGPKPPFGAQVVVTNEALFESLREWVEQRRLRLVKVEDRDTPDGLDTYCIFLSESLMREALAREALHNE